MFEIEVTTLDVQSLYNKKMKCSNSVFGHNFSRVNHDHMILCACNYCYNIYAYKQ